MKLKLSIIEVACLAVLSLAVFVGYTYFRTTAQAQVAILQSVTHCHTEVVAYSAPIATSQGVPALVVNEKSWEKAFRNAGFDPEQSVSVTSKKRK